MSDDDWEKPDFVPTKTTKPVAEVKDSWDGEDEESEEESAPAPAAAAKSPPAATSPAAAAAANAKIAAAENSIDRLNPVTMPEFEMLRNNVEVKLVPLSSSPYYNGFVEDLIRDLSTALVPENLKKINSGLTLIINDKTAAQKPQKSKKGKKGPSVKMDRGHNMEDDGVYDDYDDIAD